MSKTKLLLVEDEAAIRQMYRFRLDREGFEVLTATNGADGLKIAEENRPGLILLDLKMPVMSGDKMLKKLRATDWGADIRVIILTNISKSEAPASLRFLDVERYIVKAHSTPGQIVDHVKEVLVASRDELA